MFRKISLLLFVLVFALLVSVFAKDGQNPTIYNVTLTSADTEYSQAISPNAKKFTLQCRSNADIRLAYVSGKVATPTAPYYTVKAGHIYWEDNLDTSMTTTTLYLASSDAGVVVEIIVWR